MPPSNQLDLSTASIKWKKKLGTKQKEAKRVITEIVHIPNKNIKLEEYEIKNKRENKLRKKFVIDFNMELLA